MGYLPLGTRKSKNCFHINWTGYLCWRPLYASLSNLNLVSITCWRGKTMMVTKTIPLHKIWRKLRSKAMFHFAWRSTAANPRFFLAVEILSLAGISVLEFAYIWRTIFWKGSVAWIFSGGRLSWTYRDSFKTNTSNVDMVFGAWMVGWLTGLQGIFN